MIKTTISYFDKQQQQVLSACRVPLTELLRNQVWNWKQELAVSTRLIIKDECIRFKGIYRHRIAGEKWNKLDGICHQIVTNCTTSGHSYCIVAARYTSYISWISISLYSWTGHRPCIVPRVFSDYTLTRQPKWDDKEHRQFLLALKMMLDPTGRAFKWWLRDSTRLPAGFLHKAF